MASFQKYEKKGGQYWLFKMDVGINPKTGERQTTTRRNFKTKKEAQVAAAKLKQEIEAGLLINNNNFTFKDLFEQWFNNHSKTIKVNTQKTIKSKFKKHILPRFGQLKMKDITKSYCQKQFNEIANEIASANDIKIQANQVFKYAVKMDIIPKNPMEHVTIPKQQNELLNDEMEANERNYWNNEEIKQFLEITKRELQSRDFVLFHLLIYTGARKGELLALNWKDIDFEEASMRLTKTIFQADGRHLFQRPKTAKSTRIISLDRLTLSLLKKWRNRQKEENMAVRDIFEDKNLIFSRDNGDPLRLAYPNDKLATLIKKHNLHPITIHGLRHTHASRLFEAGASIKEVQDRLGHSDIKMTMNIYTHVTNTLKEQSAAKFQRFIEL